MSDTWIKKSQSTRIHESENAYSALFSDRVCNTCVCEREIVREWDRQTVCVRVCVWERERLCVWERARERKRKRERASLSLCVYVRVLLVHIPTDNMHVRTHTHPFSIFVCPSRFLFPTFCLPPSLPRLSYTACPSVFVRVCVCVNLWQRLHVHHHYTSNKPLAATSYTQSYNIKYTSIAATAYI